MDLQHVNREPQTRLIYRVAPFTIWVVLFLGISSIFINYELNKASHRYHDLHEEFHRHVTLSQKTHEVAIESFAGFLSANRDQDFSSARVFAQNLRSHFPNLYMLEIAQRVTHDQRAGFEQAMRNSGYLDFEIHRFGYESDRKSHIVPDKDIYYPVVFIEPELEQARSVIGLDLSDSSSILKDALERSFNKRTHVASKPFTLIEGNQGYLLYREVGTSQSTTLELKPGQEQYALLVIDSESLIPGWARSTPGLSYSLQYPYSASGNKGILSEKRTSDTDNNVQFLPGLFPRFEHVSELESRSQPFRLATRYQTSPSDIASDHLAVFLLVSLATIPFPLWLYNLLYHRRMRQVQEQERNYHLANYDALTGLPNKNLASDLFYQISTIVKRHRKKMALLYIDLDNFKDVNDQHGHQAGDQLLQHVAERLGSALRESDTLIRLHGDEFVIFINDMNEPKDIDTIIKKINSAFEHTIDLQDEHFFISMSIGVAIYPDDGENLDQLLNAGDRRMYINKRAERQNITPLFNKPR